MTEQGKVLVAIVGMVLIAGLEGVALLLKMNGTAFASSLAAITGITGYTFGRIRKKGN